MNVPMLYNKICVMLPTYGRAKTKLPKFLTSLFETAHDLRSVCISFVVNERDTEAVAVIEKMCAVVVDYEIIFENTAECNLAHYFNLAYDTTQFNDPSTCVSMFGDDMVFDTPGWDAMMLEKINDKFGYGIVYGDDDNCQHKDLCVYFITSRWYVEMTGKPFMHPGFGADWIDTIHMKAAKELECAWYIPGLHIRHEHFSITGDMDETSRRNREVAMKVHEKRLEIDGYVAGMVGNVRHWFVDMPQCEELAFVMTTYDRVPILERAARSWNRAPYCPELRVFDDGSLRWHEVKSILNTMRGASIYRNEGNAGCDSANTFVIEQAVSNSWVKAVVVLDSDTIFSEMWYFAVLYLWHKIKDGGRYCGASIFNAREHAGGSLGGGTAEKDSIGGLGAVYKRELVERFLNTPQSQGESWDNRINAIACRHEQKFLCTTTSYVQHGGYFSGVHTNDLRMGDYADRFAGEIQPVREIASGVKTGPVLFAVMARLGDVIGASMVANQLIARGVELTWAVIPIYADLVERICPGVTVLRSEPMVGGPFGDWSETNTYEMKQRFPLFAAHVNAQVGSRENHDEYLKSGKGPCDFIRDVCADVLGITVGTDYRKHLRFNRSGVDVLIEREQLPDNLAVICPEAKTAPVLTREMTDKIFCELKEQGYNPRILVPQPPDDLSIFQLRNRYLYRMSLLQCFAIILRAKMFVGNDSGMAWVSLYSDCKKRIYHSAERSVKVNTWFSKLDANAEDVVV